MDRATLAIPAAPSPALKRNFMELSQQRSSQPYGLLYPMMLIAAIAVIVFSILGIASIAGWMPSALNAASVTQSASSADASAEGTTVPLSVRSSATFECVECGMIESIREIERQGTPSIQRVEASAGARL
jgi:hypothetical protein